MYTRHPAQCHGHVWHVDTAPDKICVLRRPPIGGLKKKIACLNGIRCKLVKELLKCLGLYIRIGQFYNFWGWFGTKNKLGSESEPVLRDSKKNIRIKENKKTLLSPDTKEFQVSTTNAVMIMLFNLKYISQTYTLWFTFYLFD